MVSSLEQQDKFAGASLVLGGTASHGSSPPPPSSMKDTQGENLDLNDRADDNTQFLETVQEAAAPEAAPEDAPQNAKNGGERTAGGDVFGAEQPAQQNVKQTNE